MRLYKPQGPIFIGCKSIRGMKYMLQYFLVLLGCMSYSYKKKKIAPYKS